MEFDLVIRGGWVVDGSGFPSYVADIGIKNGKIVEVGRISAVASATRAIDAAGLVVSSSFINHHTHLDARRSHGVDDKWRH
jgi:N-acyl-D-amino-acid deacylase